ncbi:Predicted kinase [Rathayibacter oskolensis]|uniref:Predicted kinase n=1 Tax=Rathayibacter oskolensis TaxID=1891671 RepID=A0A1X7NYK2_9MICO|nr:ATP-binding protein [Rathayibacter oskolensis]SMH42902.1 Predicted kinase [Rathayibacter oskolensis]
MTLALMCGLSFAGKSTFAGALAGELDAVLISLDLINAERGLHGGQGIPLEEWATTNRLAHERARDRLAEGRHVVVDDTGSPRFIRDGWREVADAAGAVFVIVWVRIDPALQRERVLANRAQKERPDVIDAVLTGHAESFEPPLDEEPIAVDAEATRDPVRAAAVADEIRAMSAHPSDDEIGTDVLFLGGRSGVGKSSVAAEVSRLLAMDDVSHAVIEGDNLDQAHPEPWRRGLGLAERNLASMWQNYRAAGYHRLIYTNTVSVIEMEPLAAVLGPAVSTTGVLLTAEDATAEQRLAGRELGTGLGDAILRSRAAAAMLDSDAPPTVHRLRTDGRAVHDIALDVLALTSWSRIL